MKKIGPNFENELRAAGLLGLAVNWSVGEELFFPTQPVTDEKTGQITEVELISAADKKKVLAVVAAHDPNEPAADAYRNQRAGEYPAIGEQLDAILKQLNAMQLNGVVDLIPELDGIIAKWLAVKKKYPKPE